MRLGPYQQGEIPAPLVVTFTDSAGTALNLTGYTAKFVYQQDAETAVTRDATVTTAASGIVTYTWVAGDFTAAGDYKGAVWVGNSTNRYASEPIIWRVEDPPGTAPSI